MQQGLASWGLRWWSLIVGPPLKWSGIIRDLSLSLMTKMALVLGGDLWTVSLARVLDRFTAYQICGDARRPLAPTDSL
jgi:hypothetical protein